MASYSWTGSGDGSSWNDPNNWDNDTTGDSPATSAPSGGDDATVDGASITDAGSADQVDANGLDIVGSISASDYQGDGTTVEDGGSLTVSGTLEEVSDLSAEGSITADNLINDGTADVGKSGDLSITTSYEDEGGTEVEKGGSLTITDEKGFLQEDDTLTVEGTVTAPYLTNNGTVEVEQDGELTVSTYFKDEGGTTVDSGGTLTLTDPDGFIQEDSTLTVEGDVTATGLVNAGSIEIEQGGELDLSDSFGYTGKSGSSLTIEDGGTADFASDAAISTSISLSDGSSITVTGSGSSLSSSTGGVAIGGSGSGTLTIEDGATVEASNANPEMYTALSLGDSSSGSGELIVEGSGSTLTVGPGELQVGYTGTGMLDISDGATVDVEESRYGVGIADVAGSTGSVDVTGSGSTLDAEGPISVGFGGNGTLTIEDGATVKASSGDGTFTALEVAALSGSSGTLEITGSGSMLTVDGAVSVGKSGTLTIEDSADVEVSGGENSIPDNGQAGVDIEGTGSIDDATLDSSEGFFAIGQSNTASFSAENGATVKASYTSLGAFPGGDGTLTISGDGTSWSDVGPSGGLGGSGGMSVGGGGYDGSESSGGDGSLTISDGASLTETTDLQVAFSTDSTGTVEVTGSGTTVSIGDTLVVGASGVGIMTVEGGADVDVATQSSDGFIDIGENEDSTGSLDLTGADTELSTAGATYIGDAGTGSLTIEDGADFESTSTDIPSIDLGVETTGDGTLTVEASSTSLMLDSGNGMVVGDAGVGDLEVQDGASVDVASSDPDGYFALAVGNQATGDGTVNVDGDGSTLTAGDGGVGVGVSGQGFLTVSDGATVDITDATYGLQIGSFANSVGSIDIMGDGSTLSSDGPIVVGVDGQGTMTVEDGADVDLTAESSDQYLDVGENEDGSGSLVLTGPGTDLVTNVEAYIGDGGTGSLTIEDGANFESTYADGPTIDLGFQSTGDGTLIIEGSSTSLIVDSGIDIIVGDGGLGDLEVQDGASLEVTSTDPVGYFALVVGNQATGDGIVTIDGADSTLTVGDGGLGVGDAGQGTLTVSDGATVDVTDTTFGLDIGVIDGATGTVDVTGDGSTLNSDGPVFVGDGGTGTLTIEDGGTLTTASENGYVSIGSSEGGDGTVTITGASSTAEFGDDVIVGDTGTGTLDIEDGASVTIDGYLYAGEEQDSSGEIIIAGDESNLTVNGDLILGEGGEADLTISDSGDLTVTGDVDAGNSTVDIEGDPTIGGDLNLGVATTNAGQAGLVTNAVANWTLGGGATLTVTGSTRIGVTAGDMGTLTVTGANTQFVVETDLIVGDAGTGTLNVQNATVTNVTGAITLGSQTTGTGQLTINGNGSTVNAGTQDVTVGDAGSGTLNVQMAGLLDASSVGLTLGSQNGSIGAMTVANEDSEVDAGTLTVGDDGSGTVTISDGGELSVGGDATLGGQSDGSGTITVADDQSSFDVGGDLTVGDAGSGALIDDGDASVSGKLSVGAQSGGSGQVTVAVGTLDVDGDATVGDEGSGTLLVELGGTFTAENVALGKVFGSSGMFSVDGDETSATTNDLTVGTSGDGELHVSNGASFTTHGDATLGDAVSANIQTATVDTQANWGIDGDLTVGGAGIATMSLTSGGSVTDSGNVVLGDQGAASGELTVSGFITTPDGTAPSTLNWGDTLTVGSEGQGILTITNGALVAPTQGGSGEVDIAAESGSKGTLSLSGMGSTLDAIKLAIGGTLKAAGGTGTLTVGQGDLADIIKAVTMWSGTLDVSAGGQAIVGNPNPYSFTPDQVLVAADGLIDGNGTIDGNVEVDGTIDATHGTLTINGDVTGSGTIDVGDGATLVIDGNLSGTVSIEIEAGATVELGGFFGAGASINFDYASDGSSLGGQSLIIDNPDAVLSSLSTVDTSGPIDNGSITGLAAGDDIVLKQLNYSSDNPIYAATIKTINGSPTLDVWGGQLVNGGDSPAGYTPSIERVSYDQIDIPIMAAPGSPALSGDYVDVSNTDDKQATALTLAPGNAVDLAVNGPTARAAYGVTGAGVKVGVISNPTEAYAMQAVVQEIAPGATTIIETVNTTGPTPAQEFIADIDELVAQGADVIVDDLGFAAFDSGTLQAINEAIDMAYAKGVTLVSAAGNNRPPFREQIPVTGHQTNKFELSTAAINILATPAVGNHYIPVATEPDSSLGKVDITGPDGGASGITGYDPFFGTSAAAPAVAAVAALMIAEDPGLANDPGQLYQEIEASALSLQEPADYAGAGLVQADAAVALAAAERGNYFTQAPFELNVTGTLLSQPGNVTPDEVERFVLTMSEGVTVNGSGTPSLLLNDGGQASYDASLSNPSIGTLVFDYQVGASDQTPNLVVTGFNSGGTTFTDATGNNADFSGLFGISSGTSVNSPFLAQSISTSLTGEASPGQTVQLTLTSNEAADVITGGGDPTLSLSDGATATYDAAASTPSAGQLVFDYQVGAGDMDPNLSVVAVNLPAGTTIRDADGYNADFSSILVRPTGLQVGPVTVLALGADSVGSADTGTEVHLTLALSGPVKIDTTQGSPTLTLNDNETATYDAVASNLAKGDIVFDYGVNAADQTPDLAAASYNANGSVLEDQHGTPPDLAGLADVSTGVSVNSPLLATTATPSQTGEIDTGHELQITLAFNEAIGLLGTDGSDGPTLSLSDGATATFDSEGSDNQSLVFDYVVGSSDRASNLSITGIDSNGVNIVDDNGYQADFSSVLNVPLDVSINEASQPCYCRGTLIQTSRGEVCVEDLAIGEGVITHSGEERPIKWIGRRSYGGRFIMGRKDIQPICFKRGSLGDNVPKRDLWISPHHAMYLEGVLIEAKDLVNGVSVVQAEQVESVEYFHIELDSHDIVIAEGSLSETFIDDDSRGMFHNAHEYSELYQKVERVPARYCAPRRHDGYEIECARRVIDLRAGLRLSDNTNALALRGFVDEISVRRIAGWAQNPNYPEAPVCLDILANGRLIGQVLAHRYREDLEHAGVGSGRHSFDFTPPPSLAFTPCSVKVRRSLDDVELMWADANCALADSA